MDYGKHRLQSQSQSRNDQTNSNINTNMNIDSQDLRSSSYHSSTMEARLRRPNLASNQEQFADLAEQTNLLSLSDNICFGGSGMSATVGAGDSNVVVHSMPSQSHITANNSRWTSSNISAINNTNSNINSNANTISTNTSTQSSNLSPFAKEFVPRTITSQSQCHPIGSITQIPNGVPIWPNHCDTKNPSNDNLLSVERDLDDYIALSYLREFIDTITIKPNRYDTGISYLTEVINSYIDEDESVMSAVVNAIVDQAIIDPQFRYNGVRLCIYFMDHLRALTPESTFKLFLFRRCHREHARRECLIKSSEESENYIRGLTMFIGDLYARCSAYELADYLPQLLITLMSIPHKENLKCICQVLKLCGSNLEEYYRGKDAKDMSGGTNVNYMTLVMDQLKGLTTNSEVDAYAKELITNIIDMQTRGWTATIISSTAAINPYLNSSYTDNNSVSYGGDYYEEYNGYSDEDEFHTSYDFGQCGDEEDNEVCEAFEEFLKNSGQNNRN